MIPPSLSRRRMLMVSATGLSALAGCSALNSTHTAEYEPARLGRIQLENTLPNPQRIDLRIDRDGERVHEQTYELNGAPDESVTNDWVSVERFGCQLGVYDVSARVGDHDWLTTRIPSKYGGHLIEVEINDYGGRPEVMINISATNSDWVCNEATPE